jgi:hypothetical protein
MVKEIRYKMLSCAELIIRFFNEYQNRSITEDSLFSKITLDSSSIDQLFLESTNLPISDVADEKLNEWIEANLLLFGTIHDLSIFYNEKNRQLRNRLNREQVMKITISRYYEDLKRLRNMESRK